MKSWQDFKLISYSISGQRELIRRFVEQNPDIQLVSEYCDDGYTGTNFDRPDFQRMLSAIKAGHINCIIVKDLSRFGRDYIEAGKYIEKEFPRLGVRFIALNDHYDSLNATMGTDTIILPFKNLINDTYSRDLSVKVKTAMHTKMEKGQYVIHAPYGYQKTATDKHRLSPDPETAPIVREIFLMAISGRTSVEIARELNSREILTPLGYKNHKKKPAMQHMELRWSHTMVLNLLQNLKYTGAMVNHIRESRFLRDPSQRRVPPEEWVVVEGVHAPIVSREKFDAANAALRKPAKSKSSKGGKTDRVYYCGHCGRKL